MKASRSAALLASAALAASLLLVPRAASGEATDTVERDEPSIEEMLEVIRARQEARDGARESARTPAPAPRGTRPVRDRKPGREPERAAKLSERVAAVLKKVEARAVERLSFFRAEKRTWDVVQLYIRLEKFEAAARELAPVLRSRHPGVRDSDARIRMDRLGEIELEYARIMTYLGKTRNGTIRSKEPDLRAKTADAMLVEYRRKLASGLVSLGENAPDPDYVRQRHGLRLRFIEGYAEARREVDRLEAALAEEPDGEGQWELIRLCAPERNRAALGLKWLTALLDMIEEHPGHRRVAGGTVYWYLAEAYRHHELHEDCIELLKSMPERFPGNELCTNGEWLYVLGKRLYGLGRFREEMRDPRGAHAAYREAMQSFQRLRARYPGSGRCKPERRGDGTAGPSDAEAYIGYARRALERLGGGPRGRPGGG